MVEVGCRCCGPIVQLGGYQEGLLVLDRFVALLVGASVMRSGCEIIHD